MTIIALMVIIAMIVIIVIIIMMIMITMAVMTKYIAFPSHRLIQVERLKENREKRRAQQAQILEDQEVTILDPDPDPDPYIQQYPYKIMTALSI